MYICVYVRTYLVSIYNFPYSLPHWLRVNISDKKNIRYYRV